jgi:prepilin-type N-terminal cleavage/methylation domain-containing protein/prepilin-type processing-associated H-X9-DG protein
MTHRTDIDPNLPPLSPSRQTSQPRSGFTLVELLVVIAIIGILVSLLLPAVQSAREAARRTQCANNLRQIGIALNGYDSQYASFPPGSFWSSAGDRGSILIRLLPYVEQQAIFDRFNFNAVIDNQTMPDGTLIGAIMISAYNCPSDQNSTLRNGLAIHNYSASAGPTAHIDSPNCSCPGWNSWNAYALSPYESVPNFAGPFHRRGGSTKRAQVRDGLSNTIFFGEVLAACSIHTQQGWARSNNGNGLVATMVPINYNSCDASASDGCKRPCNWNTELAFKSRHPGGAQFVFGDGNVRFFPESIDHWNYQYLGAKADGKPVVMP